MPLFTAAASHRPTDLRGYGTFKLNRSLRVAKDVDPYGFVETDHNLFREIPLRALPWVGFDCADNT